MNERKQLLKHKTNLVKAVREHMLTWHQQIAEQILDDKLTEEQVAIYLENAPCIQAVVDDFYRAQRDREYARVYKQTVDSQKSVAEDYLKDAEKRLKILQDAKMRLERKKTVDPNKLNEKMNELARLNTAIDNCQKSIDSLKHLVALQNQKAKRPRGRPPKNPKPAEATKDTAIQTDEAQKDTTAQTDKTQKDIATQTDDAQKAEPSAHFKDDAHPGSDNVQKSHPGSEQNTTTFQEGV